MDKRLSDYEKVELLYTLYEHEMLSVCISILKDTFVAEDAVSESFVKLIRYRDKITDPKSEKSRRFVMKIAKNTAIDIYRRNMIDGSRVEELPEKEMADTSASPDFVDSFAFSENPIFCNLDAKYRAVVECMYIEGLTSRETAAVLKVSEACVRKRLERAKRLLEKSVSKNALK